MYPKLFRCHGHGAIWDKMAQCHGNLCNLNWSVMHGLPSGGSVVCTISSS